MGYERTYKFGANWEKTYSRFIGIGFEWRTQKCITIALWFGELTIGKVFDLN